MARIVFLDQYSGGSAELAPLERLGEYVGFDRTEPDQVIDHCRGAQVIISNKIYISRETMKALPELRLIAVAATGMNNVDLEAARELGIEVRNAKGYSTHSVSESTLAFALALQKNLLYFDDYVKSGKYAASRDVFHFGASITNLRGSRWGIIGLGTIGHEVARLAAAFGCEVSYFSTSGVGREEPYPCLSLEELLSSSDIVSIHSPLNARTKGLITAKELGRMKKTAVLINVARGGIVDEKALADALNDGTIAGAALDVFSQEPLRTSPLYSVKDPNRLIMSPHNAWASNRALDKLIKCVAGNISDFLDEHPEYR